MKRDDIFNEKKARPMLLGISEAFDSSDYLFELKFDGIRALLYVDNETIIINRRNNDETKYFPELSNLHQQVHKKCILDGEIVCFKDGKPSFHQLLNRHVKDFAKTNYLATKIPAVFIVFDILFLEDNLITELPLIQRKEILNEIVQENEFINIIRYIENNGKDFFNLIKKEKLEGIVAKNKMSIYQMGKRTVDWLKIKVTHQENLVICGVIFEADGIIKDLITGVYNKNNKLVYRDKLYLGSNQKNQDFIQGFVKENKIKSPLFADSSFKDIIWVKPILTCKINYSEKTSSGAWRNPVFKGFIPST
ncbi:MAG: DNA ligase [Erysipelotrichales bacterium]|nr:DNA ligase [Erysipelotrichales bacterium]